jgi:hypothetical protein
MILPGSYANGFAPRDGSPLFPELWRGCVGAWAQCLGPTGLTLRDWSASKVHGVLTNGTTWQASQGRYAGSFDGSDGSVVCAYSPAHETQSGAGWMVSAWTYTTLAPSIGTAICRGDLTSIPQQRDYLLRSLSGDWGIQNAAGGSFNTISTAGALVLNRWQHVAAYCFVSGSAGLIVDGRLVATGTLLTTLTASTQRFVTIGAAANGGNGYSFFWPGLLDDVRVYSIVNPSILYRLASRRGIAYELAPRRRSALVAGFNRRRRLLVGAGS